ncbi:MAG: 30S ribosomal protein S17 [Bryobacteraceae bacterium]
MSDEKAKSRKNEKVGQVVSTKMAKTIVVQVTRRTSHRVYQRVVTRRNKFYAHDEDGVAKMGDTVRIVESRPLSRLKRWRLVEVLRRAAQVSVEPENVEELAPAPAGQAGKR